MITVTDLVKSHGELRVLDGVSLEVKRGEVAVIVGPSGGGKSTLLRCINALEPFQEGVIRVEDVTLQPTGLPSSLPQAGRLSGWGEGGNPPDELLKLRRKVGMVFQQFNLFPHLSVLDNVLCGPFHVLKQSREEAEPVARDLLDRVGLSDKVNAKPADLSGGQQQRVAIARALAVKPSAILFDEPTSALDPQMASEVLRVIADLAASGQTMVVVTHAMDFARRVANRVHVMHAGRIAESGPPDQVFGDPREEVTRSFLKEVKT